MSNIILDKIKLQFGELRVLDDFSLMIDDRITCIIGESGTGKTSILNVISELVDYSGKVINKPKEISYIFQSTRLIPNLTVWDNIDYILKGKISDKEQRIKIIERELKLVELYNDKDKYPYQLSGGMAQRLTMARAFSYPSQLILMDEPFKALDIGLKKRLIDVFLKLWEKDTRKTLYVTHDIDEALLLSDRIILIKGSPAKIEYDVDISLDKKLRSLNDNKLVEIRKEIYKLLT